VSKCKRSGRREKKTNTDTDKLLKRRQMMKKSEEDVQEGSEGKKTWRLNRLNAVGVN
jgi:hypothetical protein